MNIVIGLCHVDFSNIDTSESYLKQIVACEIISISSSAMCVDEQLSPLVITLSDRPLL